VGVKVKRSNSRNRDKTSLIPKYSGCGPGGMNSSLMINHKSKEYKEDVSMRQTVQSLDKVMKPLIMNK
jgi:hypothetical protein